MTTPEEVKAWTQSTAQRTPPTDWYGRCAGLTWQTIHYNGGVSGAPYASATAAYDAARAAGKIESTDPSKAPAGAIHYWSYYGKDYLGRYGDWGHVTIDIYGGGSNTLGATHRAHEYWGVSAGLISVAEQTVGGMKYLGWARTYGDYQRITINGAGLPAGEQGTDMPLDANDKSIIKDAIFEFFRDTGQINGEDGWKFVREAIWGHPIQAQTPEGLPLTKNGKPVKFPASGFEASTNAQTSATRQAVAAYKPVTDAQIKVIADAVKAQIGTPSVKLDYAAIAKAVNDDAAKRLSS